MASFAFNLKLCRALEKQPILYNHSHEDYRKRLASENCWDLVASEVGDSVEKCKRRWRQIRTDYSRWMSSDEQRQINGLKRPPQFYLAEELAFLKPHLSQSDQAEREGESAELERDRKSKSKEPLSKDSPNKGNQKEVEETVEELPLAHLKRAAGSSNTETETGEIVVVVEEKKEKDKNKDKDTKEKTKEKDTNKKDKKLESKQKKDNKQKHTVAETVEKQQEPDSIQTDDKEQSEGTATPTASLESAASAASDSFKQPEFFIKQSTNRSSNNLIIGKKRAVSPPIDPLFHQMAEDSPDETASIGGGRRLRRSRIKHNAIEKIVAEQRVTRGRRKSIAVTAATSLLRTSPVKMTPLPRTSLPAKPQAKTQPTPPPPPPPKPTTPNIISGNDDIFPRARAAAAPTPPQQQQVVMARMPSAPVPPQQQRPQPIAPPAQLRGGFSVLRMQAPPKPGMPSSAPYGQASASAVRTAVNVSSGDVFKMPATGATTATTKFPTHSQAQTQHHYHPHSHSHQQVQAQQQQPQRLVSNSNTLVITSPSCSSSVPTPVLTLVKRCERGIQTESPDTFSDDHFLDMLRPQMKEMNQRQKMHFKQKIFHSLMETFDDATDFPSSGEVQHFNINTPSGYDHVTDRELRLIRELASLVTADKHTADPKTPSSSPGSNHRMVQLKQQVLHRVIRPTHGGSVASSSLGEEQKKLYRVMQMANNNNNNNNNNKALAVHRRESIDSNSSNGTSTTGTPSRPMHFVVPTNSNKTTPQSKEATSMLTNNQNAVARVNPATGDTTSTGATLVRQMGRRYSVCGPVATFSSNNAALTNSTTTDATLLKRRIVASPLAGMPPQQKPRFSTSPVASAATGQAMNAGDSFLMPRSVMNGGQTVRQKSPTGPNVSPVQLRPPQKASIQNRAGKEYVTPTFMRGNSVSGTGAAINYGIGPTTSLSPQKRSMVIANVKGNVVQKSQMRTQQAKQLPLPSTGANVANLLSETTRKQAEPERRPSMVQEPPEDTEMAGIIAADDFDMTRFKREPQDIVDDHDILGM